MFRFLFSLFLLTYFAYAKGVVTVSIPPQAFFVEKIAKDTVDINVLIPPNSDEHSFELKPSVIKELEKSDIYFAIGFSFEESLLKRFKNTLKHLDIVKTQENINLLEQSHNGHKHSALDTHIWLDPILVKVQAQNITNALIKHYPQHKNFYENNLKVFHDELDSIDSDIKKKFQGIKNNKFIVYHPSWSYFAKRYELMQIPVQINNKEPKARDLQRLIDIAKGENIKVVFIQKGFSKEAAQTIAKECNARLEEIDHLSIDWKNELLKSADILAYSLKE